jgi:flavin-dependent dehydrogenase
VVDYDIIIAGGGLSGLYATIKLSSKHRVLLLDPHDYPRHKMCGEFLSAEVAPLLSNIGIDLDQFTAAQINQLQISLATGKSLETTLPLGGHGVSRYNLDHHLYQIASEAALIKRAKVINAFEQDDSHHVHTDIGNFTCRQFIIATGKRSILDKELNREFIKRKSNWMAVKMHYTHDMPWNQVQLHNFEGGYAGLSRTEDGAVNLCYLATYASFKKHGNIESFQRQVLSKNKHLKQFFQSAVPLWEQPITISQISFDAKLQSVGEFICVGDAAGLIHPLCGNGMAMAIHSAHIASDHVDQFLQDKISREQMITNYTAQWRKNFKSRLRTGRLIQYLLMQPRWTKIAYGLLAQFPSLLPLIISRTHGKQILP